MRGRLLRLACLLLALFAIPATKAHEVRPGLLQLTEVEPERYELLWRVPARGDRMLSLQPLLPENCREIGAPTVRQDGVRSERRSNIVCDGGLAGATVGIGGLQRLRTDVLVRVDYLSGGSETLRAVPENPQVVLSGQQNFLQIAGAYLMLGIEHILLGIDHLLFVLALLLLVGGWKRLVATVTAFTVAHSITLAAATLGFVSAPASLIEALIALSIVFVAAEVIHLHQGKTSLAIDRPWLIAFAFGLLHGFGFAGALRDVGLPAEAVPTALLFFNLGVESGQLLFIAAMIALSKAIAMIADLNRRSLRQALAYGIGIMAGFWTIERVVAIWV